MLWEDTLLKLSDMVKIIGLLLTHGMIHGVIMELSKLLLVKVVLIVNVTLDKFET